MNSVLLREQLWIFIPKVRIRSHQGPKWITPNLKHQLNCLNTLRRKCKSRPSSTNLEKLITSQLEVQKSMAEAKAILENNCINGLARNNSSMIYKCIHRPRKNDLLPPTRFLDLVYQLIGERLSCLTSIFIQCLPEVCTTFPN